MSLSAHRTIDRLAAEIGHTAPALGAGAIVLVDSPRWPRDLDWSRGPYRRDPASTGRKIDAALRGMTRVLGNFGSRIRLSMFPTPAHEYFARCARDPRCKPHLAAIARELFGELLDSGAAPSAGPLGGAIFTRFMLAGFATYRALQTLGVAAFESYPYLQFRLSSPSTPLPPKRRRAEAIGVRRRILARLAVEAGISDAPEPASLDQADAAVLALGAARAERTGVLAVVSDSCEGSFMAALATCQALHLGLADYAS